MLLIYINDISVRVKSKIRLFADGCALYSQVGERDARQIQDDSILIEKCCSDWKVGLNVKKCVHISFTKEGKKLEIAYFLNNEVLKNESRTKYLGVTFLEDCSWNDHVDETISKTERALSFIQRNLRTSK